MWVPHGEGELQQQRYRINYLVIRKRCPMHQHCTGTLRNPLTPTLMVHKTPTFKESRDAIFRTWGVVGGMLRTQRANTAHPVIKKQLCFFKISHSWDIFMARKSQISVQFLTYLSFHFNIELTK